MEYRGQIKVQGGLEKVQERLEKVKYRGQKRYRGTRRVEYRGQIKVQGEGGQAIYRSTLNKHDVMDCRAALKHHNSLQMAHNSLRMAHDNCRKTRQGKRSRRLK